jgi:hypothetical protein
MERLEGFFFFIMIIILVGFTIVYYTKQEEFNLKCIISTVDGNKYCVREREKMDEAANKLARITQKCVDFIEYLKKKHPDDERVQKLVRGFNPKRVNETLPTSTYTAFSENKGEKTAFCLNKASKTDNSVLIDDHTLMFVALHELTHDMTHSIGHQADFWENFRFLLNEAKKMGIHEPIDYSEKPVEYCGMTIHDNPFYAEPKN